jgi:hypothetical protein
MKSLMNQLKFAKMNCIKTNILELPLKMIKKYFNCTKLIQKFFYKIMCKDIKCSKTFLIMEH